MEFCAKKTTEAGERFFPGWLYDENDAFVQDVKAELEAMGYTCALYSFADTNDMAAVTEFGAVALPASFQEETFFLRSSSASGIVKTVRR